MLLDSLLRAARRDRYRVSALHIDHQLSPNARRWSAFCRRLCAARGVPLKVVRVAVRRNNSIEAGARAARYAVFAGQGCDCVALAHHRDDQVETVLLQLLRGAGVKGLSAMPAFRGEERGERREAQLRIGAARRSSPPASRLPPRILRPLLDATRKEILEYAKTRALEWVEDESNQDTRYRRNALRHEVLPVIERHFPAYRDTLARTAQHLAEAADVLSELASRDGEGWVEGGTLAVEGLRALPPARARNLLRHFLAGHGVSLPGTARLQEMLRQVLGAKQDARVRVDLGEFALHRYRDRLHVVPRLRAIRRETSRRWRGERTLALPELGGILSMTPSRGEGVSLERLREQSVTIRVRRGGERLQPDCSRPRRSLKKLLQEGRLPPWLRGRSPLIFCGTELVWCAGVGVDCRYQAAGGERAVLPVWRIGGI